jgi:hypothetical protein
MDREPLMADQLRDSASQFARSAMQAFLDSETAIFLLHAATSLEHLAKSLLGSNHASLIAADDFDSLLHACGLHHHARRPPTRMRTVGMEEALKRCIQLVPSLSPLERDLDLLRQVRNGVVHLGQLDPGEVRSTLVPFLKACQLILTEMEIDTKSFWGPLTPEVEDRLAQSREEAETLAAAAVRAAKGTFRGRFQSMDDSWRKQVLTMIVESYELNNIERQLRDCPACSTKALLEGTIDVDYEVDFDYSDGQAWIAGAYPTEVIFIPKSFRCKACGLHLEDADQLFYVGIDSWELTEYDPDLLREWEQRWAEFEP